MDRRLGPDRMNRAGAGAESATTAGVLFELTESVGEVDDDPTATPGALVAVVTGEHLEVAAIDEEPDLDEIVAAVVALVCVRVAHADRSARADRR